MTEKCLANKTHSNEKYGLSTVTHTLYRANYSIKFLSMANLKPLTVKTSRPSLTSIYVPIFHKLLMKV